MKAPQCKIRLMELTLTGYAIEKLHLKILQSIRSIHSDLNQTEIQEYPTEMKSEVLNTTLAVTSRVTGTIKLIL